MMWRVSRYALSMAKWEHVLQLLIALVYLALARYQPPQLFFLWLVVDGDTERHEKIVWVGGCAPITAVGIVVAATEKH
jgi:hypothetical protein